MIAVRNVLVCGVLVALIGLMVCAARLLRTTEQVITTLPSLIQANLQEQGNLTRAAALVAIADTRRDLLKEVTLLRINMLAEVAVSRHDVLVRADALTDRVDKRLVALEFMVDKHLTHANNNLEALAETAGAADPVLQETAKAIAQVNDALPLFLDCDHNPECIFNRYVGTARATEKGMMAMAASAPATAKSVESATKSVASIAASWEKQVPLYVKVASKVTSWVIRLRGLLSFF